MSGFLTRAALDLEPFGTSPIWPAAAPEAVTVLLPVRSENLRDHPVAQAIARTHPRSGPASRTRTAVRVEGPMTLVCTYDGLSAVWAWCLGLQHSSRPTELVSGAYQHLYEIDPVFHSHPWPFGAFDTGDIQFNQQLVRRATLAIERTTSVWEHLSVMVRSLTVHASPGGVSLALNLVGHSTDRASATNTTAVIAALSEPDWQRVAFTGLEARLAPFSASTALDSDDAFSLSAFRLDVSHHLKTRQRRDTGLYIGEPRRDQLPEVRGALTLPYYESDTFIDWALSQEVLMAELRFTGAAIGATGYNFQLAFWLPALQLEAPEAGTQGPVDREPSFNFRAVVTETDPAGFPTFALSGPLYVELVNADSVNVLTGVDQAGGGGGAPEELGGVTDGLRLHFIADSIGLNDNDPITSWADENAVVTLTPPAGQDPTYKTNILNGHAVARFTPNDGLIGTNVLSDMVDETGFTVLAVIANLSTCAWGSVIATDSSSVRDFILSMGSTGFKVTLDAEDHTTRRDGTTDLRGAAHVIAGRFDGTATEMDVFVDGVNDNSGTPTIPADVTMNGTNLWIGKAGHTTRYFNGDIAEVVFYDRALTSQEQADVEAYLTDKYGL